MPTVTNKEFLDAIFGPEANYSHVTDFTYDPGNIPSSEHLRAWKGNYFSRYFLTPGTNQYFTISLFDADQKGVARRRKALFKQTNCIVLDDVKEKLSLEEANKLPQPSWILETSAGSEQWGYILSEPCTDRHRVENLLDGLVANGLAPDGRDPGMKGVTRYVRLPEGANNKASKLVNGQPFQCRMLLWNPFSTVTLEQLARPFGVNLDAERREARVDGAAQVLDHPILQISDLIHIKEVRSAGRFDITCPWVDEHTNSDDSGTAVFTNGDGTIGFKCHHGACQGRTGNDLLKLIEKEVPGFGAKFNTWKMMNAFSDLPVVTLSTGEKITLKPITANKEPEIARSDEPDEVLRSVLRQLRGEIPGSQASIELASRILYQVDQLPEINKIGWHNEVCDIMRWSKREFDRILKDLRGTWYDQKTGDISFFDETIYVAEQNQFFDRRRRIWYTAEAYQNAYAHLDSEARSNALQGGRVTKVHKIDYAPLKPPVFEENGIIYGNGWHGELEVQGAPGDVRVWLDHFDTLGWGEYRDHILKWMAWTIVHPDIKINHMIIFGSGEGCGKDWLLYPLVKAMGDNHMTINGEELLDGFNDYILSTKHLHINEAELGDKKEARAVSNKLKPLAAAPPDHLRANQKNVKPVRVRNLLSVSMTTNSQLPVQINGHSRRMFPLWSDLNPRDEDGNLKPEWDAFWTDAWAWMKQGGYLQCIHYLRNQVDLSQFNPGKAPPVTAFLRDIIESSRSPVQQTLFQLIKNRAGVFAHDLVTVDDVIQTIAMVRNMTPDLIYVSDKVINPALIAIAMKELGHFKVEGRNETGYVAVWVVRNHNNWKVSAQTDIIDAYELQGRGYMKEMLKPTLVK